MAQHAGVTDAHAAYGAAQQQDAYALLRRVSHWPQDDVEREKTLLNDATIIPTYRLDRFDQLLNKIEFQSFEGRSEEHTSELQSLMRNSYAVFCLKKNTNKYQN